MKFTYVRLNEREKTKDCLYGLDNLSIDDLLEKKTTRKELIRIQIKMYYRIDSSNKKY